MDWNVIGGLIRPELAIVLAVCWIVGNIVKLTPRVPDWSIVYIVTVVAILAVCFMAGWTVESVLQGVLCGAVAVYGHQLIKQASNGANEDKP